MPVVTRKQATGEAESHDVRPPPYGSELGSSSGGVHSTLASQPEWCLQPQGNEKQWRQCPMNQVPFPSPLPQQWIDQNPQLRTSLACSHPQEASPALGLPGSCRPVCSPAWFRPPSLLWGPLQLQQPFSPFPSHPPPRPGVQTPPPPRASDKLLCASVSPVFPSWAVMRTEWCRQVCVCCDYPQNHPIHPAARS